MKRDRTPSVVQIAKANESLTRRLRYGASRWPESTCWACGYESPNFKPERAHVVPHSAGGGSDPSNFFLLCHQCHRAQPDSQPREIQEEWLLSVPHWLETSLQTVRPMVERIMQQVRSSSDEATAREYLEHLNPRLPSLFLTATHASPRIETLRANFEWSVVADFKAWRAKRAPESA